MYKKIITYTDLNGFEQQETHYFNISKAELFKMQVAEQIRDGKESVSGGFSDRLQRIGTGGTGKEIIETMEELINKAWGVRSEDGRSFIKRDDLLEQFKLSLAYDALLEEVLMDPEKGLELIQNAMPSPDGDSPNRGQSGPTPQQTTVQTPPPAPPAASMQTQSYEQVSPQVQMNNQPPMQATPEQIQQEIARRQQNGQMQ